jgi:hypothetical protein
MKTLGEGAAQETLGTLAVTLGDIFNRPDQTSYRRRF